MLKAAIEKIQEMVKPEILDVDGKTMIVGTDGGYTQVRLENDRIEEISLTSLDALANFIKKEAVSLVEETLFITVPSHMQVNCFTSPRLDDSCKRTYFYTAKATDVPGWGEKMTFGFEEAQIALRTRFQPTNDTQYVQELLSDISTGNQVTYNDNGIATTVVTKRGVSLQKAANIRSIVNLRPYRTFQEVEQPASDFLIRVSERSISILEADGGMWKLAARKTIKEYLETALIDLTVDGKVVISL